MSTDESDARRSKKTRRRSPNAVLMTGRRLRHRPGIKAAFAGDGVICCVGTGGKAAEWCVPREGGEGGYVLTKTELQIPAGLTSAFTSSLPRKNISRESGTLNTLGYV